MSDNYPIMGMRRKPYIIISMAFMSFNWAMMALAVNGKYGAIFCLLGANLGCAVANVCCEAITVPSLLHSYMGSRRNLDTDTDP